MRSLLLTALCVQAAAKDSSDDQAMMQELINKLSDEDIQQSITQKVMDKLVDKLLDAGMFTMQRAPTMPVRAPVPTEFRSFFRAPTQPASFAAPMREAPQITPVGLLDSPKQAPKGSIGFAPKGDKRLPQGTVNDDATKKGYVVTTEKEGGKVSSNGRVSNPYAAALQERKVVLGSLDELPSGLATTQYQSANGYTPGNYMFGPPGGAAPAAATNAKGGGTASSGDVGAMLKEAAKPQMLAQANIISMPPAVFVGLFIGSMIAVAIRFRSGAPAPHQEVLLG